MEDVLDETYLYKNDIIFAYCLTYSRGLGKKILLVLNKKQDNIKCLNEEKLYKVLTIPYDEIEKISNIIKDSKLRNIKEVEFPPVLDGTTNEFYFKINSKIKTVYCYNLWYWNNDTLESAGNAKILLDVYNQINDILSKYDISMNLDL